MTPSFPNTTLFRAHRLGDFGVIERLGAGDVLVAHYSTSPDLTATRTFLPSRSSKRTRVGLPSLSATATFEMWSGAGLRSMPPCGFAWSGLRWRACTLMPSTRTLSSFGSTRSEEHPSELQSLMRISYAVFCLKKKK